MNNAFCICSSALRFFFVKSFTRIYYRFNKIDKILINEEITNYIAGIFIKDKINDSYSNIFKI